MRRNAPFPRINDQSTMSEDGPSVRGPTCLSADTHRTAIHESGPGGPAIIVPPEADAPVTRSSSARPKIVSVGCGGAADATYCGCQCNVLVGETNLDKKEAVEQTCFTRE